MIKKNFSFIFLAALLIISIPSFAFADEEQLQKTSSSDALCYELYEKPNFKGLTHSVCDDQFYDLAEVNYRGTKVSLNNNISSLKVICSKDTDLSSLLTLFDLPNHKGNYFEVKCGDKIPKLRDFNFNNYTSSIRVETFAK
ncbi:hypothetical protein SAMN05444392_11099 [Seinonella peptonophila]|uniref:Beta/gamma crystallin 'Greek key' domain-containing protein n=1 Tax=Seinonella peptonophila TaxID=112248 RepID=A0A1M4ZST5_9BACL|nr:hypothetical protein [Seinonella peptonophila]SHF21119.1 hypothetical protein SAMN05444392_11099 [Seinonella peptonophila]